MIDSSFATFYNDILSSSKVGSSCGIVCSSDSFHIIKTNWGAPEDFERNRDGEVELSWSIIGDALKRLMNTCNNAKTPKQVVDYLYKRFAPYERQAHLELLKWLDKKEVEYSFEVY